ncbi:hypothetical protein GGH93_004621 [Coemansia aciculifera]|nr:hypothetical protein GGH93_004621 [Coemansia aciculifera]
MFTLSPIQVLPLHVVQIIVNHVVGSSRVQFDGVTANSNKCKVLLSPLLWVCHNFRVIAYSRYCSHFKIDPKIMLFLEIDGRFMLRGRRGFDYAAYTYLGYPTHHLAKELEIELEKKDIYSGNALKTLSLAPYDGCAFPLARKVTIMLISVEDFIRYNDSPTNGARTEVNIGAFVERIKKMAPRLSGIGVRPKDLDELPEITSGHFGSVKLVPDTFATYTEGVQYALSIGPGAAVRKIGVPSSDELLPALSLPGDHCSIQVLMITRTQLDIGQAISLIKSLPLLSNLHAPLPRIGTMPDGVTRAELPAYMVSTYAPLGERFRCWHPERYRDSVECILLLALVCPNFDYVAMNREQRKLFMDDLEWYIDLNSFKPYASRLRRLLFNGWQSY